MSKPHFIMINAEDNRELLRIENDGSVIAPSLEAASEAGKVFVDSIRKCLPGNVTTQTFTRINGEKFTLEMTVDTDALIRDIAERIARNGNKRMTIAGGAIKARII